MNQSIHEKASNLISSNNLDEAIQLLRDEGASIIEAIKVVKEAKHISLSEAKSLVAQHPVWNDQQEKFKNFHDSLIEQFGDDGE